MANVAPDLGGEAFPRLWEPGGSRKTGATEELGEAQDGRRAVAGVEDGGGVGSHGQDRAPGGFPCLDFGL